MYNFPWPMVSAVTSSIAVIVSIAALLTARNQLAHINKQLRLQNYKDYTKRYQEIILNLPDIINSEDFEMSKLEDKNKFMRYMRAYFDLSFEEWNLFRENLISEKDWAIWMGGIKTAMARPAFKQAWAIIEFDTGFGTEFNSFINNIKS